MREGHKVKDTIRSNSRAIFLPAFDTLDFRDVMVPFLNNGGCSILVGETRDEYVNRRMSNHRRVKETTQTFLDAIRELRQIASPLIVAVDEELGGIRRLEALVPTLPSLSEARNLTDADLEKRSFETALAAKALGVTMFLSPVADVVDGKNPWLEGRALGRDPRSVARIVSSFVKGIQRAGVTAVTKHFPGFNDLAGDPALENVSLRTTREVLLANALPFRAAIAAGTKAVMAGPAPVVAFDESNAACVSPEIVRLLRTDFAFSGLVVSDDLDAPATMRGTLLETAIASLNAGVDLLLVAGGPHLYELCEGVADATERGLVAPERLADAANRVRAIAATP